MHLLSSVRLIEVLCFILQYQPLITMCYVDRVIQKKKRDYSDPNSSANMKKLNDDLQSIHNIMRKTIDDVLDR
jgi:hypothetical protein